MKNVDCHILIEKAEDIENCWVGLCLEFDVASQGYSIGEAISMVIEATMIVVSEGDLFTNEELASRLAPEEEWDKYHRAEKILACGEMLDKITCATTMIQLPETKEEQEQLQKEIDALLSKSTTSENSNED